VVRGGYASNRDAIKCRDNEFEVLYSGLFPIAAMIPLPDLTGLQIEVTAMKNRETRNQMPDSPEPEVNPVSGWEQFAISEYQAISHAFSSGLNTMAVLLPLFFIFTGAVLNYVAGLFREIARPLAGAKLAALPRSTMHPIDYLGTDYRILQVYFITAIAVVFTVWSLAFVFVFREGAGKMLQRASEIENLFPGLPPQKHKSFDLLNRWYNSDQGFRWLRTLFWSTVAFYVLVVVAYVAIVATAFLFNRL
jgi:hypothetical protein